MVRAKILLTAVFWIMAMAGLAQPFSAVVSFGDSLSDTTNNPATGDYWAGRWSNGPLWDEYLAADFGATLYDDAFSGSETSALASQVAAADAVQWNETNTLFTIWSGANDFIDNAAANGFSLEAWNQTIAAGVKNISDAVSALADAGARHVLVLNVPDLSLVPAVTTNGQLAPFAGAIRGFVEEFNVELAVALGAIAKKNSLLRITLVDDFAYLDKIIKDPMAFGFTSVTIDALAALDNPAFEGPGADYLFWDAIHPTTKADALVAQLVTNQLAELPPIILAGPISQTVAAGSQVTFTVEAQNATAYQWFFRGRKIPGATNAMYVIPVATAGKAGAYSLVASNALGAVTSSIVKLSVDAPPRIVVQPRSENGIAGRKVLLSARAAGSPPLSYQWQLDGSNIAGATRPFLLLTNLPTNAAGAYVALAQNPVGVTTSRVAMLNIIIPPTIAAQPQAFDTTVGGTVTFSVNAAGTEPLHYQWQRDGVGLPRQTNASLTLPNLRRGQAGRFRVVVWNLGGRVASSNAVLRVEP